MIGDGIIKIISEIFKNFFANWEDIDLLISDTLWEPVKDFFSFIFYFLPMDTVITILTLWMATMLFRIIISLLKTLWDILPLV